MDAREREKTMAGLRRGKRGGHDIIFQPESGITRHGRTELQQHSASAAAGIEHGPCSRRAVEGTNEHLGDQRAQAAIPPHAVLDRVHALVFNPFQARARPANCLLPVRL